MHMKDINTIRRENLHTLLQEAGTQERLGELCDVSHIYLNQIIKMRLDPTTGKIRNVGNKLARKLEQGMSRPEGWMDTEHTRADQRAPNDFKEWPFQDLSYKKVMALSETQRVQLETAIKLSAATLGLDVSNEPQIAAKVAKEA